MEDGAVIARHLAAVLVGVASFCCLNAVVGRLGRAVSPFVALRCPVLPLVGLDPGRLHAKVSGFTYGRFTIHGLRYDCKCSTKRFGFHELQFHNVCIRLAVLYFLRLVRFVLVRFVLDRFVLDHFVLDCINLFVNDRFVFCMIFRFIGIVFDYDLFVIVFPGIFLYNEFIHEFDLIGRHADWENDREKHYDRQKQA